MWLHNNYIFLIVLIVMIRFDLITITIFSFTYHNSPINMSLLYCKFYEKIKVICSPFRYSLCFICFLIYAYFNYSFNDVHFVPTNCVDRFSLMAFPFITATSFTDRLKRSQKHSRQCQITRSHSFLH
jgi:hypothetical protein